MNGPWTLAFAPVAGLAVNALMQMAAARLFRERISVSIILGMVCGLVATLALIRIGVTATPGARSAFVDDWLLESATYAALSFGFWTFLNLNITSFRIRIMRTILHAGGSLALADMLVLYSPAERLRRRLKRLENGGQLTLESNRWRLSSRQILLIGRCVECLRALVLPGLRKKPRRPRP